ncbi:serine hydroxymethyltransferase [Streptomyces sp. NPDC046261]|uniref:serine hydroxymethyltransferase n=1 Tax=Streptomyces sp. NPDC046261 TaxID=3157200 RepID=UPI0033F97BA4
MSATPLTPAPARAAGAAYATEAAERGGPHPAWGHGFEALLRQDPELAGLLLGESERQATGLQLIAAENFTSPAVLAALGSPLTNKYAEGYPGARHHGGCELVDLVERIATDRAKALFGAGHANVQPHSGTAAVLAAYAALLRPGDTVLAMGLRHGGHLTHGSPANFSGRWFDFVGYGVREDTGLIDYAQVRALAEKHRPRAIVCGSISYPRHPDYAAFREIADEVGAYLVVDAAHPIGLVAGGAAPNPVPYADVVCATTHKVLRGPRGGLLLCGPHLAEQVDRAVFPFTQGGAQMHTVAAKAVAFGEAATPEFTAYAHRVVGNARALAAALAAEGLGIVTGGTDTHLLVADVAPLALDAATARRRLAAAAIVLDVCGLAPGTARGLRLGTAALTTQGMDETEMAHVGMLLGAALRGEGREGQVRAQVADLAGRFPPYRSHM